VIVSLPGTERNAMTVLNEVIQQAPANVLLIFQREDGSWECDASHMPVGHICAALMQLEEEVRHKLFRVP
jgi:hypothetical protein